MHNLYCTVPLAPFGAVWWMVSDDDSASKLPVATSQQQFAQSTFSSVNVDCVNCYWNAAPSNAKENLAPGSQVYSGAG